MEDINALSSAQVHSEKAAWLEEVLNIGELTF